MRRYIRGVLGFLLLLSSAQLFAQATASANLAGTVYDKSQAVVADAQVVDTSDTTGQTRTTSTNSTGSYRFDLLPAGNYTLKITKQGFATLSQKVELLVGQTFTVDATV